MRIDLLQNMLQVGALQIIGLFCRNGECLTLLSCIATRCVQLSGLAFIGAHRRNVLQALKARRFVALMTILRLYPVSSRAVVPLYSTAPAQVVKELVGATPAPALQAKTRLGQTPLYLAAYWVRHRAAVVIVIPACRWRILSGHAWLKSFGTPADVWCSSTCYCRRLSRDKHPVCFLCRAMC